MFSKDKPTEIIAGRGLPTFVEVRTIPPLPEDEIQICRIDLPGPDTAPGDYLHLLSSDERARAERLRAGQVRLQFVVARAGLRVLLGSALGIDPKVVPITRSNFGKPETPGIFYNVAHSGATILIALSRNRTVGVDVEYFNREVDALEIAKSSFSASEYERLASIDNADDLRRAFFACWTRKEAVIKADGRGLSLPLESFEVPVGAMPAHAHILIQASDYGAEETYCVRDISWGGEVAAAFAVAGENCGARGFLFSHNMLAQTT